MDGSLQSLINELNSADKSPKVLLKNFRNATKTLKLSKDELLLKLQPRIRRVIALAQAS